jgi:type IV secretion system protein VirB6
MTFLADIEGQISAGFSSVASAFGAGLLSTFRPLFIVGFSIWIMLIAYEVAFGKSEDGITHIITKIMRMFLIGTIALYGWPEISELLSGIKSGFVGDNLVSTILEAKLINPMLAIFDKLFVWYGAAIASFGYWELAELAKTVALFVALFIVYAFMAMAVAAAAIISLAMYLIASSIFTLLLAIGPFFLLCLAFPFTQRFFETYIGNVMTSIFAMTFTILMVSFVSYFFNLSPISSAIVPFVETNQMTIFIRSFMVLFASKIGVALLIIYMYYKIFDLASALGGGINLGNNIIGAMRRFYGDAQRRKNPSASPKVSSPSSNQIEQGASFGRSGAKKAAQASQTVAGAVRTFGAYSYNRFSSSRKANA